MAHRGVKSCCDITCVENECRTYRGTNASPFLCPMLMFLAPLTACCTTTGDQRQTAQWPPCLRPASFKLRQIILVETGKCSVGSTDCRISLDVAPYRTVAALSSAVAAGRRKDCTPVQCLALRDNGALDARLAQRSLLQLAWGRKNLRSQCLVHGATPADKLLAASPGETFPDKAANDDKRVFCREQTRRVIDTSPRHCQSYALGIIACRRNIGNDNQILDSPFHTTSANLLDFAVMKGWGTGDPRENPPTSGIGRHVSHMRKSGRDSRRQSKPIRLGSNQYTTVIPLDTQPLSIQYGSNTTYLCNMKGFSRPRGIELPERCKYAIPVYTHTDLPWCNRLVRHRSGVLEALDSNPGQGIGANLSWYSSAALPSFLRLAVMLLVMCFEDLARERSHRGYMLQYSCWQKSSSELGLGDWLCVASEIGLPTVEPRPSARVRCTPTKSLLNEPNPAICVARNQPSGRYGGRHNCQSGFTTTRRVRPSSARQSRHQQPIRVREVFPSRQLELARSLEAVSRVNGVGGSGSRGPCYKRAVDEVGKGGGGLSPSARSQATSRGLEVPCLVIRRVAYCGSSVRLQSTYKTSLLEHLFNA
ncbi:hypothetical protein PR048_025311 [Dryococelus australis]|uniref:Uncharacterized protein n=1 Tax=Dryococelus australis TaxID=614101 RepID=A0ABQ9GR23_9NEOP|nr:hypothetical protein PR048_025311 [Dryococelus australis]